MIIAATGHRPPKLGGYGQDVRRELFNLAMDYLEAERPASVISGMALGWDQAFALAAVMCGIPLTAAVPFEGQHLRWPADSQRRFELLLSEATTVHIVSDIPGDRAMQKRNEWMVDQANKMCALWDGSWGGTFNCLRYAKKVQRPVDNLWDRWVFRDLL
ncbi:SLOG family protein [Mesorhizobium sp.]|uniref:SLOG family protein n=1 Tax=Mesorhizobium sp. TaxID=1871066 RepID=UPI000FEA6FF1|nr:SLOG family protein [Mesorhizobium sp.]RWE37428.1 MAG: DUF1273 family protein [Mesorhizobium sp.]